MRTRMLGVLAVVAVLAAVLASTADATRPRHPCSKRYTRYLVDVVSLSATVYSPGCGGAALMAGDIDSHATSIFPRSLPKRYVVIAHGTNRAGDPRAIYRCAISDRSVKTRDGYYRQTTALCRNVKGDSFKYVFDMA